MTPPYAALSAIAVKPPESAVDESSTPTFERVLGLFEKAPPDVPFEAAHLAVLAQLQKAAREHYVRILNTTLERAEGEHSLAPADIRGAQMLNRRIADAFAEAAQRLVPAPQLGGDETRIAELALASLRSRVEEVKWHAFEQSRPQRTSWQNTNALMLAVEALSLERQAVGGDITLMDAFAHCLLLATLNVGILTAPQVELAHRWLVQSAHDIRIEPFFDPEAHWYQIDLARPIGPVRVAPEAAVSETTRFLVVSALGARLAHARAQLYDGKLTVGAMPNHIAALHFGAFLDLAERLWSLDWRRSTWRPDRDIVDGETIEVVQGFDLVRAALDNEGENDAPPPPIATWTLHDKSNNGLGAIVPDALGTQIPLGVLIAFRRSDEHEWELGTVVRRIRGAEDRVWTVGIKRLSDAPVAVDLKAYSEGLQLESEVAPDTEAIYAPIDADTGRIDGLVIPSTAFGQCNDFYLPAGGGAFRVHANRIIDRGDLWVRVGFEVLGKR